MRANYSVLLEAGYDRKKILGAFYQWREVVETLADYAAARGEHSLAGLLREAAARFGEIERAIRDGDVVKAILAPGGKLSERFREASALVPLVTETEIVYRYDPASDGKLPIREMRLALDTLAEHVLSRDLALADKLATEDNIETARARGLAGTASLLLWRYLLWRLPMTARWHTVLTERSSAGVKVLLGRRAVAELAGREPEKPVAVEVSVVPARGGRVYVSYTVMSGGATARLEAGSFPLRELGDALRRAASSAVSLARRLGELGATMDEAEAVLSLVADELSKHGFRAEVYRAPGKNKVILSAEKRAGDLPVFVNIEADAEAGKAKITLTEALDASMVSEAWLRHLSKITGVKVSGGALDLRDRTVATVIYEAEAPTTFQEIKRELEGLLAARRKLHELNMTYHSLGEAGRLALLLAHEEAGLDTEKIVGLPPELLREPLATHIRFRGSGRRRLAERLAELGLLEADGENVRLRGERLSSVLVALGLGRKEAREIERKVARQLSAPYAQQERERELESA